MILGVRDVVFVFDLLDGYSPADSDHAIRMMSSSADSLNGRIKTAMVILDGRGSVEAEL